MHELSVCQALLTQVEDIVRSQRAEAVECITIEVGPLSGTEPALLLNAFLVMRAGSAAATATLLIERSAVEITCLECGKSSKTPSNRLICMDCGGWRIRVIAGDSLRLLKVAMRMPQSIVRDPFCNAEPVLHV